jgi:hypothetical protein
LDCYLLRSDGSGSQDPDEFYNLLDNDFDYSDDAYWVETAWRREDTLDFYWNGVCKLVRYIKWQNAKSRRRTERDDIETRRYPAIGSQYGWTANQADVNQRAQ